VVVNRNTIPGDKSAAAPSGIRLGTPWLTQRGFNEKQSRQLADIIADVCWRARLMRWIPSARANSAGRNWISTRLNDAKLKIRKLSESAGIDFKVEKSGYPHFYYIDDKSKSGVFELSGQRARQVLDYAVSCDMSLLKKGKSLAGTISTPAGVFNAC
jgi:glycine hydroxymethyltransferase